MKNYVPNIKNINKIVLIGPIPPPNGGMALQGQQLKILLEQEDVAVNYIATNEKSVITWVNNIVYVRAVFRLICYIFRLINISKEYKIWHILSNSGWSWFLFSVPAIIIGKIRGNYIVINYRGGGADNFLKKWRFFFNLSLKLADALVVPSLYLKKVFEKYKITADIVPNIIDEHKFNSKFRVKNKSLINKSEIALSITRNLESIYGVEIAILAFKKASEILPNLKLNIAGEGDQKKYLQKRCDELALSQKVIFLGRLSQSDIIDLYQKTDILINPSLIDNMPNSLLEAMACGIPIITSDAGGIPYMVKHKKTAWIVKSGDVELLSDAIISLIKDDALRSQLIQNALVKSKHYFWSQVKVAWLQIYQQGR